MPMEAELNHDNDNIKMRDLLLGAKAIADFLGVTPRQVYRLIYDDCIPSFKLGGTVAARRSTLMRWLADQEANAA